MNAFPAHIRACIFILIALTMATAFQYIFLRRQVFSLKWSALWASITGVTFVAGNIWILVIFIIYISAYLIPKSGSERITYYFLLLPIIPALKYEIPGIPGIRYLFNLTYPRILVLVILLPLFLKYLKLPKKPHNRLLSGPTDKIVMLYYVLLAILAFREASITGGLRGDFILFLDIILPYFVISRYVNSIEDVRKILIAIFFSAIMLSFVSVLEARLSWNFYNHLESLLNFKESITSKYLHERGGVLRIPTTMKAIPFGYFLALAIGIFLYLRNQLAFDKFASIATLALLLVAIFYTGSRGAWLTAIIITTVYYFLIIRTPQMKFGVFLLGTIVLLGLFFTDSVPVYEDQEGTFDYRVELIKNSFGVIMNNFFFGTLHPNENGALEVMRQGQGIIDIVNTYIQVALHSGVSGFLLFASIFLTTLIRLYKKYNKYRQNSKEAYATGVVLSAMLLGTIILIGTVSSVSFIPIYYWALIALCNAYIRILPTSNTKNS